MGQSAERIFYSTFSPQDWDIYISKEEGKSFKKFTDHPSLDYDAIISPDGKWVVFTSERSGINDEQAPIQPIIFSPQMYGEIVADNLATKERFRLTHNKWEEGTPLWVE